MMPVLHSCVQYNHKFHHKGRLGKICLKILNNNKDNPNPKANPNLKLNSNVNHSFNFTFNHNLP